MPALPILLNQLKARLIPFRCPSLKFGIPFALLLGGLAVADASGATPCASLKEQIIRRIDQDSPDALERLKKAVEINSSTGNLKGVAAVAGIYEERLKKLGFQTWRADLAEVRRSTHLFARNRGGSGPRILLVGHMDTVFDGKGADSGPQTKASGRVYGAGVADMKGGNEAMLSSLEALHDAGLLQKMNIVVAFMGDEEDLGKDRDGGHRTSRGELISLAKETDVALSFEMAKRGLGYVKHSLRGKATWRLEVRAKGGHSAGLFRRVSGPGAIYPLSKILSKFHRELRRSNGITLNVGLVAGGAKVEESSDPSASVAIWSKDNVIPAAAVASGDLRFLSGNELSRTRKKLTQIVQQEVARFKRNCPVKGCPKLEAEIVISDLKPSVPATSQSKQLLEKYSQVSQSLGFGPVSALAADSTGAADINFVAQHVPAILDGLGPSGVGSHSLDESIEASSLAVSTKRASIFLCRLQEK